MINWSRTIRDGLVSGSYASLGSTAGLALAARQVGKRAMQPLNATSHWLNGPSAAAVERIDGRHTAVGYATNHAASVFWAVLFEAVLARRRAPVGPVAMLRDAVVMSAVAAAVDYGATPKRFTPGWEFVLSKKGMAVAYAGLALGLAAGALATQRGRDF